MPLQLFHPIVEAWFRERFGRPTWPQEAGWPEIVAGRDVLIAAPTGSGKTLAAFLACIDALFRQAVDGALQPGIQVVYVSPLKALSNDVHRNLEVPLAGVRETALAAGLNPDDIRVELRTGDTPQARRAAMVRKPPHILVTTPESLYLMLTAARGRDALRTARTVIVDEIHALVRDRRGAHLALSLERLDALCSTRPVRIGLSATVKPIEQVARYLAGTGRTCRVLDSGHARDLDLGIEVPPSELGAVCTHEQWAEIYTRMAEMIRQHRSTLVFVNTRRLAERVAKHLRDLLGEDAVSAHHGSLARHLRLKAEERLKAGELKAIVATASLELGIDVGSIDLVCQIGSPRSIATFLQRIGRSGHSLGVVPKGRLFPLTRDELFDALALLRAVRHGRLDAVRIPEGALDILAQQMVAAVACEDWTEDALYNLAKRAWPYRSLEREDFDDLARMLSEGLEPGRRSGAYLHRDAVHRVLRARRGARIAALTSGGAIPDNADYRVVTSDGTFVGTVNEDFAVETQGGDVFLLGNTSWRLLNVRGGEVLVEDARGAPASAPFWLGEAPARTAELSTELSELRRELEELLSRDESGARAAGWLVEECQAGEWAARQAVAYAAAQVAAIGLLPTQKRVVFERFFDETGGMQLVVHAPFGGYVNRAWGLALRKRFCRSFDFELQAAANDNGVLLSLGPEHTMPTEKLFRLLKSHEAEEVLVQALLASPMFQTRWRWNVTRALGVLRIKGGKRVPPPMQRWRSDDLLTAVFPAQTACQDNNPGDVEVPDHPLVKQTVHDCLTEATDAPAFIALLREMEAGRVELFARDTREPSPFTYEILNSQPYTFLDDAPLEERRARAVATRRVLSVDAVRDLGRLDPEAIAQVREDAWPLVRDREELHDALLVARALPASEGSAWRAFFEELAESGRATELRRGDGPALWVATENVPLARAAFPEARCVPPVPELERETAASPSAAWVALARGRLETRGPLTVRELSAALGLKESHAASALEALEGEGFAMRGRFDHGCQEVEWCERRLLARIHRLTLERLRRRIEPVESEDFVRYLLEHQHVAERARLGGREGLRVAISKLQGFEIPAGAWEHDVLPARVEDYSPAWLDELTLSGAVAWGRLDPPGREEDDRPSSSPMTRAVPISLVVRDDLGWLLPPGRTVPAGSARAGARKILELLTARGALFFQDLRAASGLLPSQVEDALGELVALGLVSADGFAAIRTIVSPRRKAIEQRLRTLARPGLGRFERGGRWTLFPPFGPGGQRDQPEPREGPVGQASLPALVREAAQPWARQLLLRYGVVFRDLLTRESVAPPWRVLAAVFRQMEARGEIRGGRFVSGVGGEQFAIPDAVEQLRAARDRKPREREWTVLSAADPVNLAGIVTAGARIPATRTNRVLLDRGRLRASLVGQRVQFYGEPEPAMARMLEGRK